MTYLYRGPRGVCSKVFRCFDGYLRGADDRIAEQRSAIGILQRASEFMPRTRDSHLISSTVSLRKKLSLFFKEALGILYQRALVPSGVSSCHLLPAHPLPDADGLFQRRVWLCRWTRRRHNKCLRSAWSLPGDRSPNAWQARLHLCATPEPKKSTTWDRSQGL